MRVDIVAEIANLKSEAFEEASESQALADFRAAVRAKESFFHLQDSVAGFQERSGQARGTYVGRFVIAFRRLDLSADRGVEGDQMAILQGWLSQLSGDE